MAFLLSDYRKLLESLTMIRSKDIITITEAKRRYDQQGCLNRVIILRHDVDRKVSNALEIAKLESEYGIRSTFYFRCDTKGTFPEAYISQIASLGHEVGYHYECLSECSGNYTDALRMFRKNLGTFRGIATCNSVSMHGAPLSKFNNQDLLTDVDLNNFNLDAEAILSFQALPVIYYTDTGGKWKNSANLRDYACNSIPPELYPDEVGVWSYLALKEEPIFISTHPERWESQKLGYLVEEGKDTAINLVKIMLNAFR